MAQCADQNCAILVGTGAYAPVHRQHVEMFEAAKEALESHGVRVVAGYISPSHDTYVDAKLKDKGYPAIPWEDRLELVRLAIADSPWLEGSGWEAAREEFVPPDDVVRAHGERVAAALEEAGEGAVSVGLYYVAGADVARHYTRGLPGGIGVVAVGRAGEEDLSEHVRAPAAAEEEGDTLPAFLVAELTSNNTSSTAVREAMAARDASGVASLCHPAVATQLCEGGLMEAFARARAPVVIAVGGATRAGKTTLTEALLERLGGEDRCATLHQDEYFMPRFIMGQLGGNWEIPEGVDHARLLADLERLRVEGARAGRRFIIVEGFLIYHDPALVALVDVPLFLMTCKDTTSRRRGPCGNFESQIWACHVAYRDALDLTSMHVLDGEQRPAQVIAAACEVLEGHGHRVGAAKERAPMTPREAAARAMLAEAEAREREGDGAAAVALYRRAFKTSQKVADEYGQ